MKDTISDAERSFLNAVQKILKKYRRLWPLSVGQIHYSLLNEPPLRIGPRRRQSCTSCPPKE